MPKVSLPSLPISAVFAVAKPSGPTCMSLVESLKPLLNSSKLFATDAERAAAQSKGKSKKYRGKRPQGVKIGTGGTLDPLADGVLVLGVNDATKKLGGFLECTKEYRATCLLGAETDTYDSEGSIVRTAPWKHVTRASLETALDRFRGEIIQVPPLFSALKMDGKPLYEYARKGLPLPRPIEGRRVTIHSLTLESWLPQDDPQHSWRFPEKRLTEDERAKVRQAFAGAKVVAPVVEGEEKKEEVIGEVEEPAAEEDVDEGPGPAFVLRMTVGGGTYVRSIAHDLARAVGSAAHVVTLTRTRQGAYHLVEPSDSQSPVSVSETPPESASYPAVAWDIIEDAQKAAEGEGELERDEEGWTQWERAVLDALGDVETRKKRT
ncbi:pseudouridine synthase [Exidia glandulosa HHB12029]|uniref:tRNA pseudouridine(55) synthase n=1 Tax=Exidia glandulosa HHB12029 TaxID=1314781 RepID=A0A165F5D0_EXIGL|nr:pseudouridine synthase [Exidia glandulosa HHB12029]